MTRPSFQFYPGDWLKDTKLRRCSHAARGAWIDVLCLLHGSDDQYGVLRWPLKEIAKAVAARPALLRELAAEQVLKGCDTGICSPYIFTPVSGRPVELIAETRGPVWYSSRMVRDEAAQRARAPERVLDVSDAEWRRLRQQVFERDGYRCVYCGSTDRLRADHVLAFSRGGLSVMENLATACLLCNSSKGAKTLAEWRPQLLARPS